jgi:hypothetical protein
VSDDVKLLDRWMEWLDIEYGVVVPDELLVMVMESWEAGVDPWEAGIDLKESGK